MTDPEKDYIQNVSDFVKRTLRNLEIYSEAVENINMSAEEKYEVTQIINSLLGLLVFPKENLLSEDESIRRQLSDFPNSTVRDSYAKRKIKPEPKKEDFFAMYRHMRNAIAHGSIETDDIGTIKSLRFTDEDKRNGKEVSFDLTIDEIFNIIAYIVTTIDSTVSQERFENIASRLSTDDVPIKLDVSHPVPV